MKKFTLSIVCLLAMIFAAIPVSAQTRARCATRTNGDHRYEHSNSNSRIYSSNVYRNNNYRYEGNYPNSQYGNNDYYDNGYYDDRTTWERSRDKITTGIGAAAGAAGGALLGGKKGAIIGAIAGGGAAALYTYVLRDRHDYRY